MFDPDPNILSSLIKMYPLIADTKERLVKDLLAG